MLLMLLCGWSGLAPAQTIPDPVAVLAPIVAFEVRASDEARTLRTLGPMRVGTGIVIDANGLVATIGYLLLEAATVTVYPDGPGGRAVPADVIAWDEVTGLGLLRARSRLRIPPLPLGDSGSVLPGTRAMVVSWQGVEAMQPVTIIGPQNYIGYWEYMLEGALFAVPEHPAFAGAALVGVDGRLLGIGGFAHVDRFGDQRFPGNVFVPVDLLKRTLGGLLLEGRSAEPRAWLGLYCTETADGLEVLRVPESGPAALAGIEPGDRLLSVGGVRVIRLESFYRTLWSSARPGGVVTLELERAGERRSVEVMAGDRYAYYAR